MRILPVLATSIIISSFLTKSTFAQNLPSDSSFFTGKPPTLIETETFNNSVNVSNTNYYFTIKLPDDSQESLAQVNIIPQITGEPIKFDVNRTKAFQGTQSQPGKPISLTATKTKDGLISVVFDPSIPPNKTFTIRLKAEQNPSIEGIYQFTVYAFPYGENPVGLDLGVGRFSITD